MAHSFIFFGDGGGGNSSPQTSGTIEEFESDATPAVQTLDIATADTWSDWVQVIASLPADVLICGITLQVDSNAVQTVRVQLAIGAAEAETPIIQVTAFSHNGMYNRIVFPVPTPRNVPAGTRLAFRAVSTYAGGPCVHAGCQWYVNY